MLDCKSIYDYFSKSGISFFTGVPDSLLRDFCACVSDHTDESSHVIAANEGGSIALATGHYLATGRPALAYMQNSGLGNAVNPLLSLADPEVYAVPMLIMIGWRGGPNIEDEPQHISQGSVTLPLLDAMALPYFILPEEMSDARDIIKDAYAQACEKSRPIAIVVKKGTFNRYHSAQGVLSGLGSMTREQALKHILECVGKDDIVLSTTGKTSRELFEIREKNDPVEHHQDFLTIGSMGHCSQVALGVSLAQPDRRVWCLDGDGAALMHLGGLAIIGQFGSKNMIHVIINNGAHESVGGQPTVAGEIDLLKLGEALGYRFTMSCADFDELVKALGKLGEYEGPILLEVKVALGTRADLGRPTLSPAENKHSFMDFLRLQ